MFQNVLKTDNDLVSLFWQFLNKWRVKIIYASFLLFCFSILLALYIFFNMIYLVEQKIIHVGLYSAYRLAVPALCPFVDGARVHAAINDYADPIQASLSL